MRIVAACSVIVIVTFSDKVLLTNRIQMASLSFSCCALAYIMFIS